MRCPLSRMPAARATGIVVALIAMLSRSQADARQILGPCARFSHRSAIKNNVFYVDGGMNYTEYSPPEINLNPYFLQTDMSSSWVTPANISIVENMKVLDPKTQRKPPNLLRGAMFSGPVYDTRLWMLGGSTSFQGTSYMDYQREDSAKYGLWTFDLPTQEWGLIDISDAAPQRPNYGGSTEATDLGMAFWFGGRVDVGSGPKSGDLGTKAVPLDGMLVLDLNKIKVQNVSTVAVTNGVGRVGANLKYVPEIGKQGVLVMFGGKVNPGRIAVEDHEGTIERFDQIWVFDIDSYLQDPASGGKWYLQPASGDIPPPRTQSCLETVSAPDGSSHNLFLYGGIDETIDVAYEDLYVLSLPSFTWTKLWVGANPRWGSQCQLVGKRQLMINLGALATDGMACDFIPSGFKIMDLSTMTLLNTFNAFAPDFTVNQAIVDVIGGTENGGATLTAPRTGFSNMQLKSLMQTRRTPAVKPDKPNNTKQPIALTKFDNKGAVIGAIIGGVLGFLLVLFGIWLYCRHRRNSRRDHIESLGRSISPPLQPPWMAHQISAYGEQGGLGLPAAAYFAPGGYGAGGTMPMPQTLEEWQRYKLGLDHPSPTEGYPTEGYPTDMTGMGFAPTHQDVALRPAKSFAELDTDEQISAELETMDLKIRDQLLSMSPESRRTALAELPDNSVDQSLHPDSAEQTIQSDRFVSPLSPPHEKTFHRDV